MMTKFSENDIQILIEALTSWEREPNSSVLTTSLFGSLLLDDKVKRDEMMKKEQTNARCKSQQRAEAAIRLKAKLLDLRDNQDRTALMPKPFAVEGQPERELPTEESNGSAI